jgi:hypothetical protein
MIFSSENAGLLWQNFFSSYFSFFHILAKFFTQNKKTANHDHQQKKIKKILENLCKIVTKKLNIVVTYEIRVFFEGAQKEIFSSFFLKTL